MHVSSLPANTLLHAASQAATGLTGRASGPSSFESDLASGNVAGAQSFLSALQTKLSAGKPGAAGSAISSQIAQVSGDLSANNLTTARKDFSRLKQILGQQKQVLAQQNQEPSASSLSALSSYNALQQGAFSSAVNLSMPGSTPSLSINM